MDPLVVFAVLLSAFWFCFNLHNNKRRRTGRLPPGPNPFPIIGNILQLGKLPHRSFAKLSQIYGPIFSLHLGSVYTVVVTSSAVAKETLQKHDSVFSIRNITAASDVHDHHNFSLGLLPVGTEWRKLRKICQEHLFSLPRLEGSQELRRQKFQKLRDYVQRCCDTGRVVNIGEAAYITALNSLSETIFSEEVIGFDSGGAADEFRSIFHGLIQSIAVPNIADFFPLLKPFDPQGARKKGEFYVGKLLEFIEELINKRLKLRESPSYQNKTDLLDTLLDLDGGLTVNEIRHLFVDLFVGGSDTTAVTVEWAMTELLLNPDKLRNLQHELRTVIGEDNHIQESDMLKLPYLQAVIKEVLRYHPPGPLLLPRKSRHEVEVNGYTIPEGAQLLINVWAIGRDPNAWSNPDLFEPERFLDAKIDFKGHDFDLLPFGSGRRICPGLALATRTIHTMVAIFVHNFDWKLESSGEVENAEKFALTLQKAIPLRASPMALNIAPMTPNIAPMTK